MFRLLVDYHQLYVKKVHDLDIQIQFPHGTQSKIFNNNYPVSGFFGKYRKKIYCKFSL